MPTITATASLLVSLLTGCLAPTAASATPAPTHDAAARRPVTVTFRKQVQVTETGARVYRELPVVTVPDDANAERFVNADLEAALDGAGYHDVAAFPDPESLQMGEGITTCSTSVLRTELIAFVCGIVSIGAHPYEGTVALAYDLRSGRTKRLAARDLLTDAGATKVATIVAERARKELVERGVTDVEVEPRIEPFDLHADHISWTYDRCSLGGCINGGAVVRLTCAELTPHLRADSPWTCN